MGGTGIRGPLGDTEHTIVRLTFDQTLENAAGVGAPPTSWPAGEQFVDSFATGLAGDRWIKPVLVNEDEVIDRQAGGLQGPFWERKQGIP